MSERMWPEGTEFLTGSDTEHSWVRLDQAIAVVAKLEAALAERDRMLRLAWDESIGVAGVDEVESAFSDWFADIRARVEEGSRDE